ncbi:NADPH-dependent FMN reductase [Rhodococcus sp. JS3073]|uniref:NADPH-dependent FMN reductase n=1 Tax=Rhodococcus sp. JS3073 TaxID=3002901 RepID=UPI0022858713|nr:NADPH-dependent FMN reductase [Rhodococcus sp. JS3073]WAM14921.1 NAD(P)H-dependent oxidoreductase [Rhodococcus sp. JS3073]
MMDETNHPRHRRYVHQHAKDWSATVDRADVFVYVTPEYNHGFNAVLKNALDYLNTERAYKPVGFVSYGCVSAGTRAVQTIKEVVATLTMVPPRGGEHPVRCKFSRRAGTRRLPARPVLAGQESLRQCVVGQHGEVPGIGDGQ